MIQSFYEWHTHKDPTFPIIFHFDTIRDDNSAFVMHWHENIELLYFIEGEGRITSDGHAIKAHAGEIAIINSNQLHNIEALTPVCKYHCLIIDREFCEEFELFTDEILLSGLVSDAEANGYFDIIVREMRNQKSYFKSSVKSHVIGLLVHLCRNFALDKNTLADSVYNNRILIVKEGIGYIKKYFRENIAIEDICREIGFSKYYFCRIFKEITGKTTVDYINCLRCDYARKLLKTGRYNIGECAYKSGFHNLSYFSKTYKKHMGRLPSLELTK